ncbi:MAG: DedA family protein [Planctomycetaceae bacterium]
MAEWIAATFNEWGYVGIALAMLLENVFPPLPSEAILPAAGIAARRGEMTLIGVILAASCGSLAGALLWYYIGRWIGTERLIRWADGKGKYIGFSRKDIERADAWFDRRGGAAVFFGRMVPGIRTLVSVPAGIAGMRLLPFVAYSAAGTALWSTLLALVGWWLGQSARLVEQVVSWTGIAVITGLAFWIGRRIWKARRQRHRRQEGRDSPHEPTRTAP